MLNLGLAFTVPYNHSSAVSGAASKILIEYMFLSNLMPSFSPFAILYLFLESFSSSIHFTKKEKGRQIYFTDSLLDLLFRRVELKLNLGTENYKQKRQTICSIYSLIALRLFFF